MDSSELQQGVPTITTFTIRDADDAPTDKGEPKALGRPTKFDDKTVSKILYALQQGATYRIAAHYAGISYDTFFYWKKQSLMYGEESQYYPFHMMVEQNVSLGAVRALEMIEAAAPGDWRAAAWRLANNPITRDEYKQAKASDQVQLGADGEERVSLSALRSLLDQVGPSIDDDFEEAS